MNELHKLDRDEEMDDLNSEDPKRREELRSKLNIVLKDEESLWRTRAKQHWLREGDDNTKFFHSIANGRRRVNEIGPIVDEGLTITEEDDKKKYFFRKFKKYFTSEVLAPKSFGDWKDLFWENGVSTSKLSSLTRPFQLAKIRKRSSTLGKIKHLVRTDFR